MYYSVRGDLIHADPKTAVIECGGVGYRCQITMNTARQLPSVGQEAMLYTVLNVREDALELFGFASQGELTCFKQLIVNDLKTAGKIHPGRGQHRAEIQRHKPAPFISDHAPAHNSIPRVDPQYDQARPPFCSITIYYTIDIQVFATPKNRVNPTASAGSAGQAPRSLFPPLHRFPQPACWAGRPSLSPDSR